MVENMRPTCELRVDAGIQPMAGVPCLMQPTPWGPRYAGQLQQKWISDDGMRHEWRAVPFVSGGADASN